MKENLDKDTVEYVDGIEVEIINTAISVSLSFMVYPENTIQELYEIFSETISWNSNCYEFEINNRRYKNPNITFAECDTKKGDKIIIFPVARGCA